MRIDYCLLILIILRLSNAIRVKSQITISLSGPDQYCFRLLNGTAAVGCHSERNGNEGFVIFVRSVDDLTLEYRDLPYGISKVIAVLDVVDFTRKMIDVIRESDYVAGVMLIVHDNAFPKDFSEDSACPNEAFYVRTKTELQKCKWNEGGALHPGGFMFLTFNKPVIILSNETDIDLIVNKCYNAFNRGQSNRRCMARLALFMNAAGNAEICRRRQELNTYGLAAQPSPMCDPLQDFNVFAALPPRNAQNAIPPKVLMLATRMDIATIFTNSEGGDVSALTSVVALLAVADAIGRNLPLFQEYAAKNNRQLLLSFFHGEAMGYIGSSRMMWEMEQHAFPAPSNQFSQSAANVEQIGLENLLAFLEVQQLCESPTFNVHSSYEVYARNQTVLDLLFETIRSTVEQRRYGVKFHKQRSVPFPPSSYHSILSRTTSVPGLLLTSYGDAYKSGHINSLADLEITQSAIRRPANVRYVSAAAKVLLNVTVGQVLLAPEAIANFSVDEQYVNQLMGCFFYTANWDCPLFRTILNVKKMPSNARNMFIGMSGTSMIRQIVLSLLIRSLGEKSPVQNVATNSQCDDLNKNQNVYTFMWQNDTESSTNASCCFRTSIYQTAAKSPAFSEKNYDFKRGVYSTWMESVWKISPLELYLKPDVWLDVRAAFVAAAVVLASIPIKIFMRESWFIDSLEPLSSPHQL